MKRVMVLAAGELLDTLCKELSKTYTVLPCSDPRKAEEILLSKPDALILNIFLSGMDGLEFLKANADDLPPVVMALTLLVSNTLIEALSVWDISYLIRLPCNFGILQDYLAKELTKKEASPDQRRGKHWMS